MIERLESDLENVNADFNKLDEMLYANTEEYEEVTIERNQLIEELQVVESERDMML